MHEPTVLAIPFFVLSMMIECFVLWREGRAYDVADTAVSLSGGFGSLAVKAATKVLWFGVFYALYEHRIFDFETSAWSIVALIFADAPDAARATAEVVRDAAQVKVLPAPGSGLIYQRIESFP